MTKQLYPHQRRVGQLLLEGKSVVLQAPTGSGKTEAALLPFISALEKATSNFPSKCIYAVPMRVLANQFVEKYRDRVEKPASASQLFRRRSDVPHVDIQTGEQPNDPHFEATLTFATIDQVLSSFLLAPYCVSRRLANLNAGAIAASYLVFDEFHLFEPDSTLPTTLEMLRMLRGVAPFLLMTATFTGEMLKTLADWLGAEIVGGKPEEQVEFAALPSQQKTRRYHAIDAPLTAEHILAAHAGRTRSLVVCNTVERAQRVFEALRAQAASDGIEVRLLHSRFLQEDRHHIEEHIRQKFGTGDGADRSGNLIVVATQAIEVGLDITSDTLHTELAPANALIQRAGRCARYEKNTGDVYIYRQAVDKDGVLIDLVDKTAPYEKSEREVIRLTWEAFVDGQGPLDYAGEQAILNYAHAAQDRLLCEKLYSGRKEHRDAMFGVMTGAKEERSQASRLVRNIRQQRVIIHDDPDKFLEAPYSANGFGLHPGTLQGYATEWLAREPEEGQDFQVMWLHEDADPDQSSHSLFKWVRATDSRTLLGAPLVIVHPLLAGYDPVLGFLPSAGNGWMSEPPAANETISDRKGREHAYQLETYERHLELVDEQFQSITWPELSRAAAQLENRCHWPKDSLWIAARLAVLLHDIGKLGIGWQRWVRDWQHLIQRDGSLTENAAYAHTDCFTKEHVEQQRSFRRRPNHAVEGAVAASFVLAEQLQDVPDLLRAAATAIARHHAPDSHEFDKQFRLGNSAPERTLRTLQRHMPQLTIRQMNFPEQWSRISADPLLIVPTPNEEDAYLAYTLIARALRRADQRGTASGTFPEVEE